MRGSAVTKSTGMWDHGRLGTGKGWSSPDGDAFFLAQTWQAKTYSKPKLSSKVGHQKLCLRWQRVRCIPG